MKWLKFSFPLLLAFCAPFTSAVDLPKAVPTAWQDEIFADTSNNVSSRSKEVYDLTSREVIAVHVFEVPVSDVNVAQSRYLTDDKQAEFYSKKRGKKFLKVYVPAGEDRFKNAITRLKNKYGAPSATFAGIRIQGKASYHVWDPAKGDDQAFRLKLPFYGEGSEGGRIHHNDFSCGQAAIRLNDQLTEFEAKAPIEAGTFYREVFAAEVVGLGTKVNFLIRQPPLAAHHRLPEQMFLPLHGLMSSTHAMTLAAAMNKSPKEWVLEEFIPKFADFIGKLNLHWGVFIEGHSQNISILVDRNTGKIVRFYFKDLYDVMVSPFLQATRGILPVYTERPQSVLMEDWIASEADNEFPGPFTHNYVLQSVTHWTNDSKTRRKATGIFLHHYHQALPGSFLYKLHKGYLDLMLAGKDPLIEYEYNPRATVPRSSVEDYEAAAIKLIDGFYDWSFAVKLMLANFPRTLDAKIPLDIEEKLASHFKSAYDGKLVSWSFNRGNAYYQQYVREKLNMRFLPMKNGIALTTDSGFMMGLAYGFTGKDLEFINEQARAAGLAEPREGGPCEKALNTIVPSVFDYTKLSTKPKD